MAEVVSWDSNEAKATKEPQTFDNFTYDTVTDDGILNKLDDVKTIINDVNDDISSICDKYEELKGYYDKFTDFFEMMDDNKNGLHSSADAIRKAYESVLTELQLQLVEQQEVDSELLEDLDDINIILNRSNTNEDGLAKSDNANETSIKEEQPKEDTTAKEEKTTEDTPTNDEKTTESKQTEDNKVEDNTTKDNTPVDTKKEINPDLDPAKAADEVISGKYGTGEDRKKALADAGYDPSEVQKIVNQKINGTYNQGSNGGTGGTSTPTAPAATTTPTATTPVTTPVTSADPSQEAGFNLTGAGLGSVLVNAASQYYGTPYAHGGLGKNGIDCSGLVVKAGEALGLSLPHSTSSLIKMGTKVDSSQAQPGDLIFTNGGGHVVICTGRDANGNLTAISASSRGSKQVKDITVTKGIVQIRRIV